MAAGAGLRQPSENIIAQAASFSIPDVPAKLRMCEVRWQPVLIVDAFLAEANMDESGSIDRCSSAQSESTRVESLSLLPLSCYLKFCTSPIASNDRRGGVMEIGRGWNTDIAAPLTGDTNDHAALSRASSYGVPSIEAATSTATTPGQ
jgi:hypothetical protein